MKITDGLFDCEYCGQRAWGRDHVVPLAVTFSGKRKRGHRNIGLVVPACSECNAYLGDRVILTVKDRAAYLVKTYRQRYQALLKMPEWGEDELNDVSPDLRASILHAASQQAMLRGRIAHLLMVVARETKRPLTEPP